MHVPRQDLCTHTHTHTHTHGSTGLGLVLNCGLGTGHRARGPRQDLCTHTSTHPWRYHGTLQTLWRLGLGLSTHTSMKSLSSAHVYGPQLDLRTQISAWHKHGTLHTCRPGLNLYAHIKARMHVATMGQCTCVGAMRGAKPQSSVRECGAHTCEGVCVCARVRTCVCVSLCVCVCVCVCHVTHCH